MKSASLLIHSQTLEPLGRPAIWTTWLNDPLVVQPGQVLFFPAQGVRLLAERCLPIRIRPDGMLLETPAESTSSPGDPFQLWGPVGKPFSPPENSRKWLLMAPHRDAGRLYPLIEAGLEGGAEVAVWSEPAVPDLPPAVELLASPADGLSWADYIAVDLGGSDRIEVGVTGLENLKHASANKVEALLTPPMPCGFGGCGLCAVNARRGWRLACLEGPVFDWNDLEQ